MGLVTESDSATRAIIGDGAHRHSTDRSLEFHQGVSAVVLICGKSLAVGTEIDVVTNGTLVADATDVALRRLIFAKRSVTEDAIVNLIIARLFADRFVYGNESVARMILGGTCDAVGTIVPVRARKTLVAGANDALWLVSAWIPPMIHRIKSNHQ